MDSQTDQMNIHRIYLLWFMGLDDKSGKEDVVREETEGSYKADSGREEKGNILGF